MRLLLTLTVILFGLTSLRAADWPPAIEKYEALALEKQKSGAAMWQIWKYATATGRVEEMKERWEFKAASPDGHKYRLLLAFLASLEEDFDGARAEYTKATQLAPNDATAWMLRGKLEATRRLPEARASFEKAAAIDGDGSAAASQLGGWLLAHGKFDEARAVLDRGVAAAKDHEGWLTFTVLRARAALAQGRLRELIAQVEAAPPGPRGGSEMAEIYHMMWDYGQTTAEIERARQARPDDALLRRQALAMARGTRRGSEVARLLAEEVKQSPTPEKWREYFQALLDVRNGDEARTVLAAQGAVILADPGEWWADVSTLWELGLASPAAEALAAKAKEGHWESALLRAQLLLTEKKWEPAREALWSILDPAREARPFVETFREPKGGQRPYAQSASMTASIAGVLTAERSARVAHHQLGTHAFSPGSALDTGNMGPVDTLQDARDLSILYLTMAAAETHTVPAFLDELAKRIETWPRAERLFAWVIVRNPERAIGELAGLADVPRDKALDRFYGNLLGTLRALPLEPALAATLAGRFPPTAPPPEPVYASPGADPGFIAASKAFRLGKFDEAWKRFDEAVAATRASEGDAAEQDIFRQASSRVSDLSYFRGTSEQVADGAAVAVRSAYPESRQRYWGGDVRWTVEAMYPTLPNMPRIPTAPLADGRPADSGDAKKGANATLLYPPASLFNRSTTEVLARIFHLTSSSPGAGFPTPSVSGRPVWPHLKERLDQQAATLQGDEAFFAHVAAAYFDWWNQEYDDALARMRKLLAETNDPGVSLGLAAMLHERGDPAAADKVLAEAVPPAPASARYISVCRMRLAAEMGKWVTAKTLAGEIAAAPWHTMELASLVQCMEKANAPEALARLRERSRQAAWKEDDLGAIYTAMQEEPTPETRERMVAMARRVLADPPKWYARSFRKLALEALRKAGEFDAFAAQVASAGAAAPTPEAWSRLAEVSSAPKAQEAWRKVLELQPSNLQAVLELYEAAPEASEEKARLAAKILAGHPREAGMVQIEPLVTSFQKAGKLPLFAKCISEAPPWTGIVWTLPDQRGPIWDRLATAVAMASDRETHLLILRKALEVLAPAPADLRRRAIDFEIACGNPEEAGRQLVDYLVAESELPPVFAWNVTPPVFVPQKPTTADLLKLASSVKFAGEVQPRLTQAAARDATARVISMFARVRARDATVLPEVDALAKSLVPRGPETAWTPVLAAELTTWPAAANTYRNLLVAQGLVSAPTSRPVSYSSNTAKQKVDAVLQLLQSGARDEALQQARALLGEARQDTRSALNRQLVASVGSIALSAKDEALLTEASRATIEFLDAATAKNEFVDVAEPFKLIESLTEAGRAADARSIVAAARRNPKLQIRSDLMLRVAAFEMADSWQRGEWQAGTPVVWVDTDRSTPERATLAWDLGVPRSDRSGSQEPRFTVRGEPIAAGAGSLTVELYFGEIADSMSLLARFENAGARGTWSGRLPTASGMARVVISQGERLLIGEPFSVGTLPNRLRAADGAKFTPQLPNGKYVVARGGPASDGEYLSYEGPEATLNRPQDQFAVSTRIPLKLGHEYMLSAWVRQRGATSVNIGWRCLDQQGTPVGHSYISSSSGGERLWNRMTYSLSTPGTARRYQQVPANAAFLEIIARGTPDLAGLSIIEVPAQPTEP